MKNVRKAVIPVAGMGTRFLPVTKSIPKEMLPIIDIPTIHLIVRECFLSGIEEIIFITSPTKPEIKNYFSPNELLESKLSPEKLEMLSEINEMISNMKFHYVTQSVAKGSADAIYLAKDIIDDDYFAVLYGDDLMDCKTPALKQLISLHEETKGSVIGCMKAQTESIPRYGILDFNFNNRIKDIIEKPSIEMAPSNIAGLGRYIVSKNIFKVIENLGEGKGGEYQFTDAMQIHMKKEPFYSCIIDGTYYDIGNKEEYVKATINYALKRKDIGENIRKLVR